MPTSEEFHQKISVLPEHTDELKHVNNVVYLQWIQDIARQHWESLAPADIRTKYVWVVLRHEIDYKRSCKLGDELNLLTKVADDLNGPKWARHVWIRHHEKLVVEAYTIWCMMEAKTMRPVRISREVEQIFRK